MVVGGGQPVLLDVANRAEHLLRGSGQTPRGYERPRLEESRDRVGPQETAASNSRRRQLPYLFDPKADGVLNRRCLRAGRPDRDQHREDNGDPAEGATVGDHR
jgi:hypothetical protein